jgi:pimeloyl-ACP methyl ester carboxylesterase
MADDGEALAAHAGFGRYHLVGHSVGGTVAQEIALRSAARLLSLTLEDTTHDFAIAGGWQAPCHWPGTGERARSARPRW